MVKLLMTIQTIHCFCFGVHVEASAVKTPLSGRSIKTAGGRIKKSCEVDSQRTPDSSGEFILSGEVYIYIHIYIHPIGNAINLSDKMDRIWLISIIEGNPSS